MGAGTILRDGGRIGGLTTAATIWLAAALGMGIAANETEEVLMATGIALVVLLVFPRIVARIDRIRDARTYKLVIGSGEADKMQKFNELLRIVKSRECSFDTAKKKNNLIKIIKLSIQAVPTGLEFATRNYLGAQ